MLKKCELLISYVVCDNILYDITFCSTIIDISLLTQI